jgi:4-amino-4-deoxy-L-arabinose transferase-like glycosyltransferase
MKKNDYIVYGILFILLLVFCISGVNNIDGVVFKGNSDPVTYYETASGVAQGNMEVGDYFSPGYSLLLGTYMGLTGVSTNNAQMFSLLAAIGLAIVLFLLARKLTNEWVGLLTVAIFIFDPFIKFYSVNVYKEIIFNLLLVSIVYLSVLLKDDIKNPYILSGMGVILGMMIYINSWSYLLILLILYPFIFYSIKRKKLVLEYLKPLYIFVVAFFVWTLFLNLTVFIPTMGEPVYFLSNGALLLYFGNADHPAANVAFTSSYSGIGDELDRYILDEKSIDPDNLSDEERNHYMYSYVINRWLTEPGFLFSRVGEFLFKYWLFPTDAWAQRIIPNWDSIKTYLWVKWLVVIAGLALLYKNKKLEPFIPVAYTVLAVTAMYGLTIFLLRYKLYIYPFQFIICAYALFYIGGILYYLAKSGEDDE